MPKGLERRYDFGHLHFITFSCHDRLPYLASQDTKDFVERILERTRARHDAYIHAYVLMPEHVHLLMNEPPNIQVGLSLNP